MLFFRTFFWLCCSKLLIRLLPFSLLQSFLGKPVNELPNFEKRANSNPQMREIYASIQRIARMLPWHSQCFVQAFCFKRLLRSETSRVYLILGVKREGEGLQAHAWLCNDNGWLIGGEEAKEYTAVQAFL